MSSPSSSPPHSRGRIPIGARKRVTLLTLVLAAVALAAAAVTLLALYRASLDEHRQILVDMVASRAELVEALARFDQEYSTDYPGGAVAATVAQLRAAHERAPGFVETGELLVVFESRDSIRFVTPPRRGETTPLPMDGTLAEPMRRALRGETGSMVGLDHRGERVLAAYRPLEMADVAVVAAMDVAEVRAPFVNAGLAALGVTLLLVLLGVGAIRRIGGEMVDEILELEDLRRHADRRLRLAVEGAGLGFWEVDFNARRWSFSDHLREWLGYRPGSLESTLAQWEDLLHPEDRGRAMEARDDILRTGVYDVQYRLRTSDGGWRWIHSLGTLVENEPGHALGVHRDVTREQELVETLRRSENRLSAVVESLPGSLVTILDPELRYEYVAGEALALLDLRAEDFLGQELGFLLSPEQRERAEKHYRAVRKGATVDYEVELSGRTLMVRASPLPAEADGTTRVVALAIDITDRKEREHLLHRQREQLDRIVENIPRAVVVVLDPDLRVAFVGGQDLVGTDTTGRVGTPVLDWVASERREVLQALFEAALDGEHVRTRGEFPGTFREREGPIALEVSASPLRDPEGRVQGVLVLSVDVTEEWAARRALEATQQRLRLALEAGRQGTFELDVATGRIESDALYARMLGYDPRDFEDTLEGWIDRLHPDDRGRAVRIAQEYLAGDREDYRSVFRQRTAWGDWIWIRSVAKAVERDDEGRPTRVTGTHTDITREKEAERSRELLSAAVEQSSSLVLITDPAGKVEYVNPEFTRVTGFSREDAVGRDIEFLSSGLDDPELEERVWATLRAGRSFEGEFTNRRKDGTHYRQQTLISPVHDEEGRTVNYVSIARDVTAERALEDQLRQAQKMEAVGQLTGGIAHDFNNVLTGILSNVQLALDAHDEGRAMEEDLQEVQRAARHGASLVRKLMVFSRDRNLDRHPVRLDDLVGELRSFLARILPETIDVRLEKESGGAAALLDPGAMQQIVLNLATNARDAMPGGGTLIFRTLLSPDGESVILEVEDDGPGIDPSVVDRVFEPFFSTKAEGTGLGLSMVYALAERQGGRVTLESEPGRGSTFRFAFPVTDQEPIPEEPAPPPARSRTGTGTILVVEDEEAVRRAARRILERAGYTVEVAEDGAQGLELLQAAGDRIDLVVTDMVMPRMGGAALWKEASALPDHPPFLFTSGYADRDLAAELGGTAETRFLRKPWDGAELLGMVERVLREEG